MFRRNVIAVILLGFSFSASADIWRWTDMNGVVRYVTSTKALYTWADDTGKVHYSDAPDHEDAVRVELVWHAKGNQLYKDGDSLVADNAMAESVTDTDSEIERLARDAEEARYCQRAKEVYDSYVNAPRLYNTDKNGKREYLKPHETRRLLAETKATVKELCN